jgi:hypothetical protein
MLIAGVWSLCGLITGLPVGLSAGHWIIINVVGLICTGFLVGASQRSPRIIGRLSGTKSLSLLIPTFIGPVCGAVWLPGLTVLVRGTDSQLLWWVWLFGESGWWLGILIGYVFSLVRLVIWWIH